ncbi:MAG TPA: alpha/beta fold hydrolase [Stellaceae bacterium]|jgi:pimeloyl-ACP methyl ester carboxylesterase|nr:alpha/beta fold hydrolase [Stellaceae bacterium]
MVEKVRLVLLPGLLCDTELWRDQIAGLRDIADCTVADMSRDDSIAGTAARMLEKAPAKFALAGLSMGGYCAMEIMRQTDNRVTHLVLLDTGARADSPEQQSRRRELIELAEKGEFQGVTPRLLPLFLHPEHLKDKALVERVTAMAGRIGKDAFLRQQRAIMTRIDSRPSLADIKCPTLVLCGRQDILTPPALHEEISALIPGSRLELIDDSGHLSTMEQPAAVTALMRCWLTA